MEAVSSKVGANEGGKNQCSRQDGSPSLEPVALARCYLAGHYLDSRWT